MLRCVGVICALVLGDGFTTTLFIQKRPAVLVKALQIIEREEKLDEKYKALETQAAESKDAEPAPARLPST